MHRQVALDTETTGKADDGSIVGDHRIIEIGAVEIVDRKITGRELQLYVNPGRSVDAEAFAVHGISDEFLADKPPFAQVAEQVINFISGSELLIHNAKFDTAFLDDEWSRLGLGRTTAQMATVVDTVAVAMKHCPGHQVNLDNLCKLYAIDASKRTQHGALLDAQLLAEVYLAMTTKEESLDFSDNVQVSVGRWVRPQGARLPLLEVTPQSRVQHIGQVLEIARQHVVRKADPQAGTGDKMAALWGPEYEMEMPLQQENESKGDYRARCQQVVDDRLTSLMSPEEQKLYADYRQRLKSEHEAWVDEVMGRSDPAKLRRTSR